MRLLMTGGFGCIGAWIVKHWTDRDRPVWIYDLKRDDRRVDLLVPPERRELVRFLQGDVSDLPALRAAAETVEATHIIHLAGLQVPVCRAEPLLGARVNVLGTLAVFETALALKDQVQRIVYASSAAVHGPGDDESATESPSEPSNAPRTPVPDDARLLPSTHYGAFKVCNELNARVYWLDHGLTSVGLRPWTVYGVGRDFGLTSEPTKAIKSVAVNRPYAISYGGLQDLQYASDVAEIFLKTLLEPFEGAAAFNLRGQVVPIETFVAALREVAPVAETLVTHGTRQLPIAPSLDDSRLRAAFGPLPETPLVEGIRDTYQRFVRLRDEGRLDLSDIE